MNPSSYHDDIEKKRINVPEKLAGFDPLSKREIKSDKEQTLTLINHELKRGFDFIEKYEKSVTIFGSARLQPENNHYKDVTALAAKIGRELGYAIVTGGGPGVMEAANKGAAQAGTASIGLTIKLPREQISNPYLSHEESFYYFFTRKTIMTFAAEAYIFAPGGFGTLDEFFDILTLVQTHKIPRVPIILLGKDFWEPLDIFIKKTLLRDHKTVDQEDVALYVISDNHNEIVDIIRRAPVSVWWKNFEHE